MVKRLSTIRETQVRSLGREDPLEKEMPMHSSTIAWKIPWTEEPGRLQSMGSHTTTYIYYFIYSSVYMLLPNSSFILPCPPFPYGNHGFFPLYLRVFFSFVITYMGKESEKNAYV